MKTGDIIVLLGMTYWADKRPKERVDKSCRHFSCYGIYLPKEKKLVGFGTALVTYIESRPEYDGLRGMRITRDARELYRRFGYGVLNDRTMVKGLNC